MFGSEASGGSQVWPRTGLQIWSQRGLKVSLVGLPPGQLPKLTVGVCPVVGGRLGVIVCTG